MANSSKQYVVGLRQIRKELKKDNLSVIIVAEDADRHYHEQLARLAAEYGVPLSVRGTKSSIAANFGIDVESAGVGVLKQQ